MSTQIVEVRWKGPIASFLRDETPEIDLEGALNCGKTTACLWKVRNSTIEHPGIWWFLCRYADGDTSTKLIPAFEAICQQSGEIPSWNPEELYYEFSNHSRVYAFGLKAPDHLSRYAKLRGLGVSGIYCDQTEELPGDFSGELRARLRQSGYPHQLLFSPNPPNVTHWLAKEFPEQQTIPGRRYYSVSLYDNAHNLPPETIVALERAYPPGHAKHRSVVLGKRGVNVTGEPVYAGAFTRQLHVRSLTFRPDSVLLEGLDFGKHHPCYLAAQQPYTGGLHVLGGIQGQDLFLDDFLPIVLQYRAQWFPTAMAGIQTCCDPAGAHQSSQGVRYNAVDILRTHGFHPVWRENSNAPDVRLAMVERLAGYMRRRTVNGEAFAINNDERKWLLVSKDGTSHFPMLADAAEAGYVWSPHMVSVGSKQVRKPHKDGWFEHGMNCLEYLELNFGADQHTQAQLEERKAARARAARVQTLLPSSPEGWMGA